MRLIIVFILRCDCAFMYRLFIYLLKVLVSLVLGFILYTGIFFFIERKSI
jgi:hypothetical protein